MVVVLQPQLYRLPQSTIVPLYNQFLLSELNVKSILTKTIITF